MNPKLHLFLMVVCCCWICAPGPTPGIAFVWSMAVWWCILNLLGVFSLYLIPYGGYIIFIDCIGWLCLIKKRYVIYITTQMILFYYFVNNIIYTNYDELFIYIILYNMMINILNLFIFNICFKFLFLKNNFKI